MEPRTVTTAKEKFAQPRRGAGGLVTRAGTTQSKRVSLRGAAPAGEVAQEQSQAGTKYSMLAMLLVVALCLPFYFYLGSFRLTVYRLVLLAGIVPAFVLWITGRKGKPDTIDFLFIASALWGALALVVNQNSDTGDQPVSFQTVVIFLVETIGPYLIGRSFVSSYEEFRGMAKFLLLVILVLLPFGVLESVGHYNFILGPLSRLGLSYLPIDIGARHGFYRAQVVFEHPILWGVFASSFFALVACTLAGGRGTLRTGLFALPSALAAASSVSGGGLISVVVQSIVLGWEKLTTGRKGRWLLLTGLVLASYVVVDALSTRNPFQVFVSYLTFSTNSSFTRILIWQYAGADALAHPIFGIGLGDWERPRFMGPSIDNFWLATAVRYGMPALAMLAMAILLQMWRMGKTKISDPAAAQARLGLMTTYIGLIISGCTVHYWNATYCWVIFLFGMGHWVLNYKDAPETEAADMPAPEKKGPRSSRRMARKLQEAPSPAPEPAEPQERKWLR